MLSKTPLLVCASAHSRAPRRAPRACTDGNEGINSSKVPIPPGARLNFEIELIGIERPSMINDTITYLIAVVILGAVLYLAHHRLTPY